MKRIISFIILFIYIIGFVACSGRKSNNHEGHDHESHQHEHDDHDHSEEEEAHDHDEDHRSDAEVEESHEEHDHEKGATEGNHEGHNHGDEIPTIKYSQIIDGVELFVEYPALIKGESSRFIAHFTNLINYKPISDADAQLIFEGKEVSKASKVLRDGIFILEFIPIKSGENSLQITLNFAGRTYNFKLEESRVFSSKDEAIHANIPHHEPDITFLKEQAWIGLFGIEKVTKKHFLSVIHTSGKILPAVNNRITIVAQSSGIVDLPNNMVAGEKLKKGERVASIESDNLEDSREVAFKLAKAEYTDLESRYEIASELVKESSISRTEFSQLKAAYNSAKAKLEVFGSFNDLGEFYPNNTQTSSGAMVINSPRAAHVAEINVHNGDFVEQGSIIATLVVGDSYLLKVDFPKHEIFKMESVVDANFIPEYLEDQKLEERVLSVSELGGYPLFNSKTTAGNSPYIPFYFNLPDDPRLIPNSFVTVSVESQPEELLKVITLPISSVLENEGSYWVYVENEGENFSKREVMVGDNNGKEIVITEGLKEGEIVVTQGASRVKQAALSIDIPEHSH